MKKKKRLQQYLVVLYLRHFIIISLVLASLLHILILHILSFYIYEARKKKSKFLRFAYFISVQSRRLINQWKKSKRNTESWLVHNERWVISYWLEVYFNREKAEFNLTRTDLRISFAFLFFFLFLSLSLSLCFYFVFAKLNQVCKLLIFSSIWQIMFKNADAYDADVLFF